MTTANFVSVESQFDTVRRKNFYIYAFISSFVWMCFHFTLVFFFGIKLESPLLVGLFLGFGNAVSLLVDAPIGVLQKKFTAKQLFIASAVFMLIVSCIFIYFIYGFSPQIGSGGDDVVSKMTTLFLGSGLNWILLIAAVTLYGIIKELSDVTSLSYIMNNADPSEYAEILSKNNILSGFGCLFWLLASGVILAMNTTLAVLCVSAIIATFIVFILKFFDNSNDTINIDIATIVKFKFIASRESVEKAKDYVVAQIKKTDFVEVAKTGTKFIFLKPIQITKNMNFTELYETTKHDLKSFYTTIMTPPWNMRILFMMAVIIMFGFWDTFAVTFLIEFLDKLINSDTSNMLVQTKLVTGYVFIGLLAVPAYGLQVPFISLSKKIGIFSVVVFGVGLAGLAVILFGFASGFTFALIFGLLNGAGYAASMPLAQSEFSEEYNSLYAKKNNLQEIDSNASSAPLKIVLNFANVLGLIIGGLIVAIVGFNGTFLFFGACLVAICTAGLMKKKEWKL